MSNAEMLDNSEGITSEERAEIARHIDGIMRETRVDLSAGGSSYAARHRGILLPVVANLSILAAVALAGAVLTRALDRRELAIAAGAGTVPSAESKLISTLRAESDRLLREKDRAILDAQAKIGELSRQESELRGQSDAALRAREQQLEAELQSRIASERALLAQAKLSDTAQAQRLREFEQAARLESAREVETARNQLKVELSARLNSLSEQASQARADMETARQERVRAQADYSQREADLRRQLAQVQEASQAQASAASQELERLREQRDRAQLALSASMSSSAEQTGQLQDALERLDKTQAQLTALRAEVEEAQAALTALRAEGGRAETELTSLRAKAARLEAAIAAVKALRARLAQAETSVDGPSTAALPRLLQSKILVRDVLNTEPARSQYPALSADLDSYYDALEKHGLAQGRADVVRLVAPLLKDLEDLLVRAP